MKLIVITTDTLFDGEASALNRLFEDGMPALHLRKPTATAAETSHLLLQIKEEYHNRIVLHDHFDLLRSFRLKGIHLNGRNPVRPEWKCSSVSLSCHSIERVEAAMASHDYLFLSPLFDSISKAGYRCAFTEQQLVDAKAQHTINEKVVGLGGINAETIPLAAQYGFGGVAVLGALWSNFPQNGEYTALASRLHKLMSITDKQ